MTNTWAGWFFVVRVCPVHCKVFSKHPWALPTRCHGISSSFGSRKYHQTLPNVLWGQNCPFGGHWPGTATKASLLAASPVLYHVSLFQSNLNADRQESAAFSGWPGTVQILSSKFLTCCVPGLILRGGTILLTLLDFHQINSLHPCSGPSAVTPRPWASRLFSSRCPGQWFTKWHSGGMSHHTLQSTCQTPRGKADSCNKIHSRPFTSKLVEWSAEFAWNSNGSPCLWFVFTVALPSSWLDTNTVGELKASHPSLLDGAFLYSYCTTVHKQDKS